MFQTIIQTIIWTDPAVQSSIIGAAGSILATVIGSSCAALIGAKIAGIKRLKEKHEIACNDLRFLQLVEKTLIKRLSESSKTAENAIKLSVRDQVRTENQGQDWSGKFVPSRLKLQAKSKS